MNQLSLVPPPPGEPDRNNWATPQALFDRVNAEFEFVRDICAEEWSAKCQAYWSKNDDAFQQCWAAAKGWLWCNPPFDDLIAWTREASLEANRGARIVMLLPAHRCEQEWFHHHVIGVAHEVRFIRKRVAYVSSGGIESSSPAFGSMLVVYNGPNELGETRCVAY